MSKTKKTRLKKENWNEGLKRLQKHVERAMKKKGIPKKSTEQIIEECRKIREQVWEEEFSYNGTRDEIVEFIKYIIKKIIHIIYL